MSKPKKPGTGKKPSRLAKKARNVRILEKSIAGKTGAEIASEEGLARQNVSKILNHSPEAVEYEERIRKGFEDLVDDSMQAIRDIVNRDHPFSDGNRLKAALSVIERVVGKVPQKFESKWVKELDSMTDEQLKAFIRDHEHLLSEQGTSTASDLVESEKLEDEG